MPPEEQYSPEEIVFLKKLKAAGYSPEKAWTALNKQRAKSMTPQYSGTDSTLKTATETAERSLAGYLDADKKQQPLPEQPEKYNKTLSSLAGIASGGMEAVANITTKPLGRALMQEEPEYSENPTIAGVQKFGQKFAENLAGGPEAAYGSLPGVDVESQEFKGAAEPMKFVGALGTGIAGGALGAGIGKAVASTVPKLGGFLGGSLGSTAGVAAGQGRIPEGGELGWGLALDSLFGGAGMALKPLLGWAKGTKAFQAAERAAGKEPSIMVKGEAIDGGIPADVPGGAITEGGIVKTATTPSKADITGQNLTKSGLTTQDANTLKQIRNELPPELGDYAERAFSQAIKAADESLLKKIQPARGLVGDEIKSVFSALKEEGKKVAQAIKAESKRLGTQPEMVVSGILNDFKTALSDLSIKIGKNNKLDFTDTRLAGASFGSERELMQDLWDYLTPKKGDGGSLRNAESVLTKVQNAFDRIKKDDLYETVYAPVKVFRDSAKTALEEMADSSYKQLATRSAKLRSIVDEMEGWFGKDAAKVQNVIPRLESRAISTPELQELLVNIEKWAKEFGVKGAENISDKATISVLMDRLAGVKEPQSFVGGIERAIMGATTAAGLATSPALMTGKLIMDKLAATPKQREAIAGFLQARDSIPQLKEQYLRPLADNLDQAIAANPELRKIPYIRTALKALLLGEDETEVVEEEDQPFPTS